MLLKPLRLHDKEAPHQAVGFNFALPYFTFFVVMFMFLLPLDINLYGIYRCRSSSPPLRGPCKLMCSWPKTISIKKNGSILNIKFLNRCNVLTTIHQPSCTNIICWLSVSTNKIIRRILICDESTIELLCSFLETILAFVSAYVEWDAALEKVAMEWVIFPDSYKSSILIYDITCIRTICCYT